MLRVFFSLFLIIPWLSFAGVSLSEQRIIYQGEISAKNNQHVAPVSYTHLTLPTNREV